MSEKRRLCRGDDAVGDQSLAIAVQSALQSNWLQQVEELLGRLRGVLPQAPWLGGVLQHAAWGPGASLRGALFMNSETYDEGAVGCMLRGPLRFDQLSWQVRLPHRFPAAFLRVPTPLLGILQVILRKRQLDWV